MSRNVVKGEVEFWVVEKDGKQLKLKEIVSANEISTEVSYAMFLYRANKIDAAYIILKSDDGEKELVFKVENPDRKDDGMRIYVGISELFS